MNSHLFVSKQSRQFSLPIHCTALSLDSQPLSVALPIENHRNRVDFLFASIEWPYERVKTRARSQRATGLLLHVPYAGNRFARKIANRLEERA